MYAYNRFFSLKTVISLSQRNNVLKINGFCRSFKIYVALKELCPGLILQSVMYVFF